ncbi:chitinase ii [Lucifera butyrica]|uniref:Chitinase ii n=1 Tax=Lucifera butyrica TaxID=1351585 RepID=A0A498RGK3_9FIRM|nr:glycosyl hydrolase family 18 protein [Lucifera butyrica]VBB09202.1 chitinase ii [Lucifera butyrica]
MTADFVPTPEVLAYYVGTERSGLRYQYLKDAFPWITYLGTVNYTVDEKGNLHGITDPDFLEEVLDLGIRPLVVPQNITAGGFSTATIHQILISPPAQKNLIDNLLTLLRQYRYDGWNLDMESISPQDRNLFSQFTKRLLAWARPEPYLASVAVAALTSGQKSGEDYRALGQTNNFLMIMTYDEHWAGGEPGPIASIPWVERVIQNALTQVPSQQIVLGIPLYGLDWEIPIQKNRRARTVSFREAAGLAEKYGADINWSVKNQEPCFSYQENGRQHIVWFQDPTSWAAKISLVFKYNLRGIGLWEMAYADPEFWHTLRKTVAHCQNGTVHEDKLVSE